MLLGIVAPFLMLSTAPELPPLPREFRAAWVATVANIDWPSRKDLSPAQQREEVDRIVRTASQLNLNALILQIRPSADAIYPSRLEPWTEFLTGEQGKPPADGYDPLQYWLDRTRASGLELHVWINPYRAKHPAATGPLAANHIQRTHPSAVVQYGTFLWMDPGARIARDRTLAVIKDVLDRYDIDGVHIDDYFYPYPVQGQDFPDEATYAAYRSRGGRLSRDDWRRQNVDRLVHEMYRTIKDRKPHVKFGISPFGIFRPGHPPGIEAGVDQYAQLYADARKWLRLGWCDYFTPQLYWPIAQTKQSFPVLLRYWRGENVRRRALWPGLFTSRTNPQGGNWRAEEIVRQVTLTRSGDDAPGHVHFSFRAFLNSWNDVDKVVAREVYAAPAAIPEMPWIPGGKPKAPRSRGSLAWVGSPRARFAVAERSGGSWSWVALTGETTHAPSPGADRIAVVELSRNGKASDPLILIVEGRG